MNIDVAGGCKSDCGRVVRGHINYHFLDRVDEWDVGHGLESGRHIVDAVDVQGSGGTIEDNAACNVSIRQLGVKSVLASCTRDRYGGRPKLSFIFLGIGGERG